MNHHAIPDLTALAQLTPDALRALWPQWFDRPPPAKIRREFLVRALAYRMQEQAMGGLTTATRTTLRAHAEAEQQGSNGEGSARSRLTPGTHIIRQWGKETHQVTVDVAGLVYRGQRYRSLSAIARRITGTRWSGPLFFGITPGKGTRRGLAGRTSR
ncbi:MAG: DUF2924 domain-containing protein [Nitrospira sp. BO4]|jgi:hypothetical protein|nr:DUF2924 domain-containing protein [Nitrospira sp. BO4]